MSDYVRNQRSFLNSWMFEEYDIDDLLLLHLIDVRNTRWEHNRIDWNYHVRKKIHENMFIKTYRMSYRAFRKLQLLLHPSLIRNYSKSQTVPSVPMHSIIAIGIWFLAGARYQDLADVHGVSKTEVYNSVDSFLAAVIKCMMSCSHHQEEAE